MAPGARGVGVTARYGAMGRQSIHPDSTIHPPKSTMYDACMLGTTLPFHALQTGPENRAVLDRFPELAPSRGASRAACIYDLSTACLRLVNGVYGLSQTWLLWLNPLA